MRVSVVADIVRLICAGAFLAALSGAAFAQPSKPVRILVGFPPGGGTDAIARTLADRLKDELGTSVIVENRPGAGGQIAAQALKSAAPDGTTFFISHDHTISILPLVMKNPGLRSRQRISFRSPASQHSSTRSRCQPAHPRKISTTMSHG